MSTPLQITQIPKSLTDLLGFKDFLPEFSYQVSDIPESEQAKERQDQYELFLQENFELILDQMLGCNISVEDKDIYLRGFKDAIAITELWLNSLAIPEDINK